MSWISTTCIAVLLGTQFLAMPSYAAPASADEEAARKLLTDYVATWNRHDMKAFAQLFTLNCDYIVWTGKQLKGRDEVFGHHDELHRGKFKNRQLSASWKDFRFVNDEIAIGHVSFSGSGPSSDGRGNTTALGMVVMTKQDDILLFDAFHNTLLGA